MSRCKFLIYWVGASTQVFSMDLLCTNPVNSNYMIHCTYMLHVNVGWHNWGGGYVSLFPSPLGAWKVSIVKQILISWKLEKQLYIIFLYCPYVFSGWSFNWLCLIGHNVRVVTFHDNVYSGLYGGGTPSLYISSQFKFSNQANSFYAEWVET